MKSDWHRYNLKRKIVNLPPISGLEFSEKVQETQREAVAETDSAVEAHCNICQKSYSSVGALRSHLNSKKHQEVEKKRSVDSRQRGAVSSIYTTASSAAGFSQTVSTTTTNDADADAQSQTPSTKPHPSSFRIRLGLARTEQEIDEILTEKLETAVRLDTPDCLFCANIARDTEENIDHMAKAHSFFIPDAEFLVDAPGLLQYLGDKISVANVCIYCNGKGKSFHSLEAVRAHMIGKGHCKIPFDDGDEDEIAEFYEFGQRSDEDGDWEEVDRDEVDQDLQEVDMQEEEEEEIDLDEKDFTGVVLTDAELILPSGIRIGHRSFRRYWNQNLRPIEITPGSLRDPNMQSRITSRYQSLGHQLARMPGGGMGVMTKTERLQIKVEKREARRRLVHQQCHTARVGQKHNMLQHHYREQNPF